MGRGGVCRKGNQVEHKMKTEGAESWNVTHTILIAPTIWYQNKNSAWS